MVLLWRFVTGKIFVTKPLFEYAVTNSKFFVTALLPLLLPPSPFLFILIFSLLHFLQTYCYKVTKI